MQSPDFDLKPSRDVPCLFFMRSAVGFLTWPLGDSAYAVGYVLKAVQHLDSSLYTLGTVRVVTVAWDPLVTSLGYLPHALGCFGVWQSLEDC